MMVLSACAVASWVLLSRESEDPPAAAATPELGAGYYATQARLIGSGTDGRILYRVSASTVQQEPADGSVSLGEVVVDYVPAARIPWSLRSDMGRIPAGGKIVQLTGNVVAETRATDRPATTIRTDYLEFDTRTDVAVTDREVTIAYEGSSVHAKGLRASLAEDRLELVSAVAGRYVR
jgi:LPS export ABC transporter protein LptC